MIDSRKIIDEVTAEMTTKISSLPPHPTDLVSAASIKQAIIEISTEIACKVIEKYEQQKS